MRCRICCALRCFCWAIRPVDTLAELVIVRHALERKKPSNTARLAALALPRCRIVDYAVTDEPFDDAALVTEGSWLLYPEGDLPPPETAPPRIIVLDGSWPQTRRMRQRLPALRGLPMLRLPAPRPRQRMRQPSRADGMSTLEAIARVVARYEGEAAAAPLERLHDVAVSHFTWKMAGR